MNSITLSLWESIKQEVGIAPSGPEALYAIVQDAQVSTATMVHLLTTKLSGLSLKQQPGQHVPEFANKVTTIARAIEGE